MRCRNEFSSINFPAMKEIDAVITWESVLSIKPNPKNRNNHSQEQIDRLVKLIEAHGWRQPLIVSKRSGKLVSGHGRLLAAKQLKLTHVPVMIQNFETAEEEYQFGIADNAIASWAELDLSGIHTDLPEIGPFDLELLGLKNFMLTPEEDFVEEEHWTEDFDAPDGQHRLVFITPNEETKRKILSLLNVSTCKQFKKNTWTLRYPAENE